MITPQEKKLIGLGPNDPLPPGGIPFKLYSLSGFGVDSTSSWGHSVHPTMRKYKLGGTLEMAFGQEFYPGSLNVRLIQGIPWWVPESFNPKNVQIGVFNVSYVLPVILNECCIAIVAAVNVRGFNPATTEPEHIDPLDTPEMYAIFSPVNIRERLGIPAIPESDKVIIEARLLDGHHLVAKERGECDEI